MTIARLQLNVNVWPCPSSKPRNSAATAASDTDVTYVDPHPTPHPLYRRQSLPADDDNWPRLLAFLLLFVLSLLSSSQAKLNRPFTTSMLQLDFGLFLSNRLISTTRGRVQSEAEKDGRRDGVYVASTRHGCRLIIVYLAQLI